MNLLASAAAVLIEKSAKSRARPRWLALEPIMVAAQPFPVLADDAEAVDVAVARRAASRRTGCRA